MPHEGGVMPIVNRNMAAEDRDFAAFAKEELSLTSLLPLMDL